MAESEVAPLLGNCQKMGPYEQKATEKIIGFLHIYIAYGIPAHEENLLSPGGKGEHHPNIPSKFMRSFGGHEKAFEEFSRGISGEYGPHFMDTVKEARTTGYRIGGNASRLTTIPATKVEKAISIALQRTGHDHESHIASNMVDEDIFFPAPETGDGKMNTALF